MPTSRGAPAPFDDPTHPLAAAVTEWTAASPRFAAFVTANRDKIRKKAKGARDAAALEDLGFELSVASAVVRDRRCALVYEPRVPGQRRAPDFALTYRESTALMLEVTRLRPAPPVTDDEPPDGAEAGTPSGRHAAVRLQGLLCAKLGQLAPQTTNVLVIGIARLLLQDLDLTATLRRLQLRVERGAPALLARYGFRDPAAFFKHYRRLSALVARPWPPDDGTPTLWVNGQATHPVPDRVRAVLVA